MYFSRRKDSLLSDAPVATLALLLELCGLRAIKDSCPFVCSTLFTTTVQGGFYIISLFCFLPGQRQNFTWQQHLSQLS